jgi:hypothetical protein
VIGGVLNVVAAGIGGVAASAGRKRRPCRGQWGGGGRMEG